MVNLEPKQHFETPKPNARYFRDKNWIPIVKNFCFFESYIQKQPPRVVLSKRCSEKMQQIYKRTPMPKCEFNKTTLLIPHFGIGVLL